MPIVALTEMVTIVLTVITVLRMQIAFPGAKFCTKLQFNITIVLKHHHIIWVVNFYKSGFELFSVNRGSNRNGDNYIDCNAYADARLTENEVTLKTQIVALNVRCIDTSIELAAAGMAKLKNIMESQQDLHSNYTRKD